MIIISHRGNLNGPDPETENTNKQIYKALDLGFEVEVDVWYKDKRLWLGHNDCEELVDDRSLYYGCKGNVWFHCKNIAAFDFLKRIECNRYFFHSTDDIALTSNGCLWTYPGKELTETSIAVLPETVPDWDIKKAYGICTDYPNKYAALLR